MSEKIIDSILFDVGSTFTKATAFDNQDDQFMWLGRSQAPTTVHDIDDGLRKALGELAKSLNVSKITAQNILATSSAAGGLRMVAMGYMPRVTAKAAKEVAMNAGARVLEVMSFEDKPENKVEMLREIGPDIILLAGGTDGGEQDSLVKDAELIVDSKANATVIIAGNVSMQSRVESILKSGGIHSVRVANVMPTVHRLNVKPARQAIHEQFIHQITNAKGLGKLMTHLTVDKVIPTPGAVLQATELLAKGTYTEKGIGNTVVVDLGGATTDIHSVLPYLDKLSIEEKGLIVSNEKQLSYRTVEGNLGLRVSAQGIIEAAGEEVILRYIGLGEGFKNQLNCYADRMEKDTKHLPINKEERLFDYALAKTAVSLAFKRHAGYIAQQFDPISGAIPGTIVGRDLRQVKTIIVAGGIFTQLPYDKVSIIIRDVMCSPGLSLLPPPDVKVVIDKEYVLYAIGLLAEKYPTEALRFAKKYFGFIG